MTISTFSLVQEGKADICWGAAEHVRQDQNTLAPRSSFLMASSITFPATLTSSSQSMTTACISSTSPTIRRAALTSFFGKATVGHHENSNHSGFSSPTGPS